MDLGDWGRVWLVRLKRQVSVLVATSLVAVFAWVAGVSPLFVAACWLLIILSLLLTSTEAAKPEPAVVQEDVPVEFDPLPAITAAYGALDAPVILLSDNATVLFQNRAAEKAFGEVPEGVHISARLRSPGILDMVRETIATGQPTQIEHSERLPSERVFILRIAPVELGDAIGFGPPRRLFALAFRDISELRNIDRMRSDFVANASHELRTPLASLRGFIETLQGPAKGDVKAHDRFLGIMLEQANRMSRLVDDLLSLSRLELKAHIAPDQKVDLAPVINHVRDALLPLAQELGVDVKLHLPESKADVLGDRDELVQVFENLIENACKYGQEGKQVDVYVRAEPACPVEVSVVDYGPGIPAEHVPRITERFYRVSVTDSRSKKGTGLGLAIVKHILTRHRARLIVKSELGKGTDFTVRF